MRMMTTMRWTGVAVRFPRHRSPSAVAICLFAVALGITPQDVMGQSPLDEIASLTVEDELLEDALRQLQRTAGVSLVFSPDLLPERVRVSCACHEVTVRQTLDQILEGTGLTYRASRTQVVIVPVGNGIDQRPGAMGAIAGRIVGQDEGAPVVNAMVRLENGRGVLANASGSFVIRDVQAGPHRLSVSGIGWESAPRVDVDVVAGDTTAVTVRLRRAVILLADILVTPGTFGFLEDVSPGTVRTLTRDEIQTMPQVGEDVFRAMTRIPGVAAHGISTKLNVRGGTDRELLQRLDGLELHEPYHMKDWDGALGIMDLNALGGLELTTGGFGVEYGNKLSGVMDMSSRTHVGGARTTLGLSISNVTALSRGGFDGDKGSWLLSARRGFMDLVIKLIGEDERLSPKYYDVFGKVSYQPSPRHLISAQVLHAGDDFSLRDSEGVEEVDFAAGWESSYGWLRWQAFPGSRVSGETVAWTGRVTRSREGLVADVGRIGMPERISVLDDRVFTFSGLRHDLSVHLSDRAMLKLGGEVERVRSDYEYANSVHTAYLPEVGEPRLRVDSVGVNLDRDGHELSGYLAARVRPLDPLTAEVGVRYDRVSHTDDEDIAPRLLMALDLNRSTQLRASWGRYHQSHGIHELEVGDGETEYAPSERADQMALGVEHRRPNGVGLRVEFYERSIADQRPRFLNLAEELTIFPEAEGDRLRIDPDRGRARGMEVLVEQRSGERWAWSASYTLAVAEDEIPGGDGLLCAPDQLCAEGSWIPRRFDQRHAVGLHVTYRPAPAWNLSIGWRYHSGWPATSWVYDVEVLDDAGSLFWSREFGPLRGERLPSYHRLDVRATREIHIRGNVMSVYLDLFNVYNRTNLASFNYGVNIVNGQVQMVRLNGQELMPILPTIGFRYEF